MFERDFTSPERPQLLTTVAALFFMLAAIAASYALLFWRGALPLSRGAWLIGGGMETMGPIAFLLYAVAHALCGYCLLARNRLGRRATMLVLIYGLVQTVPSISMAVADARVWAVARDGAQIIVRVVALWYLSQEPVREWFARTDAR